MPLPVVVLLGLFMAAPPVADRRLERCVFEHAAMGTAFRIVLYASDTGQARVAATAAFARVDALERILSDYDPDSELSRLSHTAGTGRWIPVSAELWDALVQADALARETGGAFDVTVGPLTRLWRWARRRGALPAAERLATARGAVGYHLLELDTTARRVRLVAPGMLLDLGAIGKGIAADAALAVLREAGIRRALVDAGGDVLAGDPPPDQDGWRIGIPLARDGARTTAVWQIANAAVATSGDTDRHLDVDGLRYSHILDPTTGLGLTVRRMVTVIAPTAGEADALASAVSVLGPDRGQALLRGRAGTAGRMLEYDGTAWRQRDTGHLNQQPSR